MRNLKFLMLTLLLFVFMLPVKAMPYYSVNKTETIFKTQSDLISVVVLVNFQKSTTDFPSRAKVTENSLCNLSEALKSGFVDKRKFHISNYNYFERDFYHKKIPNPEI